MADKFLNETGLTYYHNRAKTIFENKIEKVKVNGTEVTPTNKEVDLNVAEITKTIVGAGNPSIVNITQKDGNSTVGVEFTTPYHSAIADETMYIRVGGPNGSSDQWGALFPTKTYVDNNGGKIDKITVNGSEMPITNKQVDLLIGTKTSDFTNDGDGTSNFATESYVDNAVAGAGEENVIEEIQVNGVKIDPDANKAVNINACDLQDASSTQVNIIKDANNMVIVSDPEDGKGSIRLRAKNSSGLNVDTTMLSKGYVTNNYYDKTAIQDGYYNKVQTDLQISNALAGITGIEYEVVDSLPTTGEKGIIYLVSNSGTSPNVYDEYIWVDGDPSGSFEKIGTTEVDLDGYYNETNLVAITTAEIDTLFA